jgi:radical SAM superfamily enzyme YgiQ (UPF0313 family)
MEAVDFRYVFIGIETPDTTLLLKTKKRVNTRHPIGESIHRIQRHGMVVIAGFILGFDGETRAAADAIVECVEDAGIPMAMVGLLAALPNTQLTRRLAREGRLPSDEFRFHDGDADQATSGLNFTPSRPRADIFADYAAIVRRLYSAKGYFGRVLLCARRLRRQPKQVGSMRGRRTALRALGAVVWRLGFRRRTAWYFWRTVLGVLATRPDNTEAALHLMALFLHFRTHAEFVIRHHHARSVRGETEPVRPAVDVGRLP